ncbi:hypothetical protein EB796_022124 [Bugula neritina]|uniref:Uncharacterized protein n=1 Tax=Bugula neritina TaxID=10212 RepID=A0A7J7J1J7_BUGNE|nr:hypothetical protein EB796_022124 [Bugula neritina]
MSYCPRCSKRVFFAERKNSLGKDWHRQCLTCEACSKVLNPGQHAEHKGVPYCEVPCYKAIFGPKLYGFGSQVESHDYSPKVNRREKSILAPSTLPVVKAQNEINISMNSPRIQGRSPQVNQLQLQELEEKLKLHNDVHPQNFISLITKDGHVTLEGPLRVHWGVQTNIQFKKDDSTETTSFTARLKTHRVMKTRSFHSDLSSKYVPEQQPSQDPFQTLKSSGVPPEISSQQLLAVKMKRGQFHTIKESKVTRRCSINGHYYKNELESIFEDETLKGKSSDDFTPAFGSVTQVFVGSHLHTVEVIQRLLDKFKIENDPSMFALYMVKLNGEMWPLKAEDHPLTERVMLVDPTARIFLMDKPHNFLPNDSYVPIKSVNDKSLVSSTISDVWKPVDYVPPPQDATLPSKEKTLVVMRQKVSPELAGFLCISVKTRQLC